MASSASSLLELCVRSDFPAAQAFIKIPAKASVKGMSTLHGGSSRGFNVRGLCAVWVFIESAALKVAIGRALKLQVQDYELRWVSYGKDVRILTAGDSIGTRYNARSQLCYGGLCCRTHGDVPG